MFSYLFEWRYSRFDLAVNIIAYAPFGFLLALIFFPRLRAPGGILAAVLCGALLSFTIEVAQVYLPGRVSSHVDLLANTLGSAIGALCALVFTRTTLIPRSRESWFVRGIWADAGIVLIALFVISSARPSLPLMGNLAPNAGILSIVINIMLNVLAAGLFIAVIARSRQRAVALMVLLIIALAGLKLLAAWLLFRNSASALNIESAMGIVYGFVLLTLIFWRRADILPACVAALACAFAFTQWHSFAFPYQRLDGIELRRHQEVARLIVEWWALAALAHLAWGIRSKAIIRS